MSNFIKINQINIEILFNNSNNNFLIEVSELLKQYPNKQLDEFKSISKLNGKSDNIIHKFDNGKIWMSRDISFEFILWLDSECFSEFIKQVIDLPLNKIKNKVIELEKTININQMKSDMFDQFIQEEKIKRKLITYSDKEIENEFGEKAFQELVNLMKKERYIYLNNSTIILEDQFKGCGYKTIFETDEFGNHKWTEKGRLWLLSLAKCWKII